MNTTAGTYGGLSQLMQTFWDKKFLTRANDQLVMDQFGQMRPLPNYNGVVIRFSRYSNLSNAETALTEGTTPSGSNLSATNVSATVAEYGDFVTISGLVSLTALDPNLSEKVPILGTQCGQTVEALIRNEVCENGTEQIVSTKTVVASIAATDILTSKDIRLAVRNLRKALAIPFAGGNFVSAISPDIEYDFQADTTWIAAKEYSDVTDLYRGEIGQWFGVRFAANTVPYRSDLGTSYSAGAKNISAGLVFWTPVFGQEAYGITELEGERKKIYVKTPGPSDTSNPIDMYSTAGWKLAFVPKVLKSTWIRVIKTGATA